MGPCPYDHRETGCLGSGRTERSSQPRFIVLSVVPDNLPERLPAFLHLKEQSTEYPANGSSLLHTQRKCRNAVKAFWQIKRNYGQAARLISTSQLNVSRRFHTWPINLVVYQEPSGALRLGRSHLVEGFTLRCLQRFSLPDVATRRCHWRDNRYTRGPSNPVLSY